MTGRTKPKSQSPPTGGPVPIVGIGASAGGLEALETFLQNVPPQSGLAFVIVQHLDPTRKGMMVELLQRATAMPVVQITDGIKVQPDHVYIIPPDRDVSLLHGSLHLLEPSAPRGLRLPIDFFFRSLAADLQQHAIGVVLSGMGSDGTLGLRAIKEQAGASFVQDPASAKFDAMPRSAIDAGLADVIASPDQLPTRIVAYQRHRPVVAHDSDTSNLENASIDMILILLRAQTGHDFSFYKKTTISRRIERRMGLHQLSRIGDYLRYLREIPQESTLLFNEILIGVTSFFRDPEVWKQLETTVLPELIAATPDGGVLRAWVAGCSTGEEAYSLAMAFKEAVERIKPQHNISLKIFATDLDKDAIDKARAGVFRGSVAAEVPPDRLARYFVQEDHAYRIRKDIREMVVFAPHNVLTDPPFTKLDILTCRNLLIYFVADLQKRLFPLFHYSLRPGGILVLGTAESIGGATELFAPISGKSRLFSRNLARSATLGFDFPTSDAPPRSAETAATASHQIMTPSNTNIQALAEQMLLQKYCPAAVLVSSQGDIISINGKTGKYLEPAAGKANWNLFAMAREGLAEPLTPAFRDAVRRGAPVTLTRVMVASGAGRVAVDVTIQPITTPEALHGMVMVVFADAASPAVAPEPHPPEHARRSKPTQLESELHTARIENARLLEELQRSQEERQSAHEELQSTNEELQSTNEELQSTNEELMTSKEEMQSMNEELQTINHELQSKVDELSRASSDMKNLLNSTDIAILFLDDALNVRRFTPPTSSIIKLIPGDVGRPITDIVSELEYPSLASDARDVLRTLVFKEVQVRSVDERWFTVRILPYRTHDNRIDGVVITFTDISTSRRLENQLREAQTLLQSRLSRKSAELDEAKQQRANGDESPPQTHTHRTRPPTAGR